jgi:drug/metabolite transporter (DMT)-like permease
MAAAAAPMAAATARARARSTSAALLDAAEVGAPAAAGLLPPPAPARAAAAPSGGAGAHAVAVAICIGLIVSAWVAMSLLLQGLQDGWQKPWFILYTIHSGYAINLIPFAALHAHRRAAAPPGVAPPVPLRTLARYAGALQLLAAFVGYSWYLSLPSTLASANNAIYQSSALVVYLLSIPLLGEAVTAPKLAATAVSIVGVCLVSFAGSESSSSSDGSAPVHQSAAGYAWVLVSVVCYALYEIAYARMMGAGGHGHGHGHGGSGAARWLPAACRRRRRARSSDGHGDGGGGSGSEADELLAHHSHDDDGDAGSTDAGTAATAAPLPPPATAASVPPHWQLLVRAETSAFVVGAMGVWSLLTLWPVFFALHYSGVEAFELPPPPKARLLAVNVVLDAVYNLALLLGIVVSSPLYMSLGSMLVVPATVAADWAVHGSLLGGQAGGGVALILTGFLLLQAPADAGARAAAWLTGRPLVAQGAAAAKTATAATGAGSAAVEPVR